MKILAVDDDPVFLALIEQALRACGHVNFDLFNAPEQALLALSEHQVDPDCILLDIEMPSMSGIELCQNIRALPRHQQTPIIMITSLTSRKHIDQAFANGASDYATKPLDLIELKARLHSAERLVKEQKRRKALEYQISTGLLGESAEFGFDTPIRVPDFNRGIEYHALQNYLLTLGIKGLFSVSAVAINIETALMTYRSHSCPMFRAMLCDAASVVEDCLKTESLLLSYAGSGNFVGVLTGRTTWDAEQITQDLNMKMADFAAIYAADKMIMPRFRASPVIRNSLFSFARPASILDRAICEAMGRLPDLPGECVKMLRKSYFKSESW